MSTLQEIVQHANIMVKNRPDELQEIITRENLPGDAEKIIAYIKENESKIEKPSDEEYNGLLEALKKRREVSLQATFAGIKAQFLPNQFSLNNLDNNNNNLQSEKNIEKETPMADEELSQDEIEALLAGNAPDDDNDTSDQMSNDDIEALLNDASGESDSLQSDELSQDDIESLLAGNAPDDDSTKEDAGEESADLDQNDIEALLAENTPGEESSDSADVDEDDIEALLAGNTDSTPEDNSNEAVDSAPPPVESEQVSEDDIQSLLDSQDGEAEDILSGDNGDIEALLEAQEESDAEENTDEDPDEVEVMEEDPDPQVDNVIPEEETRIPSGVFPTTPNMEEIMGEIEPDTENTPLIFDEPLERRVEPPIVPAAPEPTFTRAEPVQQNIEIAPATSYQELPSNGDVRERLLQNVYALYVNTGGKPILQSECATKEEIKKAYTAAIQNFPQNSLFIEKISRKEIIVVKESREIISLKVNISFE
ncbi:MAG: hypothetical protein COA79_07090 [Planctomycetota bacterium]|nr:MAG: hypothetical protein COA79_07090 [Planctomycetota bacterium]